MLDDPAGLCNASNAGRVIDGRVVEAIDEEAFKALVRAAVVPNTSRPGR